MPAKKSNTRTAAATWLIGGATDEICGNRLPTLRNVLQYVLYLRLRSPGDSIRDACRGAIEKLIPIWVRGGIPTLLKSDATDKLLGIFKEWIELKRSMSRSANLRRLKFIASLDLLFDIGLKNGKIELEEDRLFYESMKNDRKASMLCVDRNWARKKEKKEKREEGQKKLKRRSDEEIKKTFERTSSNNCPVDSDEIQHEEPGKKDLDYNPKKRKRLTIFTEKVTSALDRTQTSDAFGAHIVKKTVESTLKAAAESLGLDEVAELVPIYSRSAPQRKRKVNRDFVGDSLHDSIKSMPGPFLVHWDGKLLPEGEDSEKFDRLPVLVSAFDFEQLLGVPRLQAGTGLAQANATYQLLRQWSLEDKVCGTVFDTTASNTGRIKGCCTLLAQKIANDLINCACRHHVAELVLEAATVDLLGDSKDPRLPFFETLSTAWNSLDKATYRTAASARKLRQIPETDDVLSFCKRQLEVKQPRGDYKELLELCIIFLGGQVRGELQYTFKKPGAISKTRWMARAIYGLKTWIFGRQIQLSPETDAKLLALCVFICRAWVRYWFEAPNAAAAPRNDIEFLKLLHTNREVGSHWEVALHKFTHHLWYLSPKLVAFSLFDDGVTNEEKTEIVAAMRRGKCSADEVMRATVELNKVRTIRLRHFATKDSMKFFNATHLSRSFLSKNPSEWKADAEFQKGHALVRGFKVVNDCAERAVQLVTKFMTGNKLTNDEGQRQLLLLTVAEDRKQNQIK